MPERRGKTSALLSKMLASAGLILVSVSYAVWHHLGQSFRTRPVVVQSHPHNARDTLEAFQKATALEMGSAKAAASTSKTAQSTPLLSSNSALSKQTASNIAAPLSNREQQESNAGSSSGSHSASDLSSQAVILPLTPAPSSSPESGSTSSTTSVTCSYDLPAPPSSLAVGGTRTMPLFANGEFTGRCAETDWGHMQVRAIVKLGLLVDVQLLLFPEARSQSLEISSWALPILAEEAIQKQSAAVDIVTQATFTSTGFRNSLASALAQAQVNPTK